MINLIIDGVGAFVKDISKIINPKNNSETGWSINWDTSNYSYAEYLKNTPPAAWNTDDCFFYLLEKENTTLLSMNMQNHYAIWWFIKEMPTHLIVNQKGLKKYIDYCKEKNITKSSITLNVGKNVPNIMKNLEPLTKIKKNNGIER